MDECFICGISGEKVRLFDAVSSDGVSKVCEKCALDERIPLLRRPTSFQLKESETNQAKGSVYDRMKRVSGFREDVKKNIVVEKQDTTLRDLVDKNYQENLPKKSEPRPDLIDNFHWEVMRERRRLKISQKQLAEKLGESEIAVKMAEQGVLPEDDNKLIRKLEAFLGVVLVKRKKIEEEAFPKGKAEVSFDPIVSEELTIADLKELKEKKEREMISGNYESDEKEIDLNSERGDEEPEFVEKKDKKDLSDKGIRSLIFRK